jgi:hypothetical protein
VSARAWIARKNGQHSDQAKADRKEAKRRCRHCPEPWYDHAYGDTGKRGLTHRLDAQPAPGSGGGSDV